MLIKKLTSFPSSRLCCQLDVMIFGDVFQEHWRNRAGTVIGVLNPRLLESRGDGQKKLSPAVTIDNASMVLAIGLCPDFGICAGTRRDGHACTMPINRAVGYVWALR